jgi:putative nucleotidyltransferase with HDIG domain
VKGSDVATAVTPKQLLEELKHLPMQQASGARLLPLLDDELVGAQEIGRIIETDPAMTARILRLANSAFLGLPNPVVSASHAVCVVGFSVVRSIAASTAAGLFDGSRSSLPADFWGHSLRAAAGSSIMARYVKIHPGDAFSAGLLHDIGQALLFRLDPPTCRRLAQSTTPDSAEYLAAERELFGMDHAEVGAIALNHWGLPDDLVEAVHRHHMALRPDVSALRKVVGLGDRLAMTAEANPGGERDAYGNFLFASADAAGVKLDSLDDLLALLAEEMRNLHNFQDM